MLTEKDLERRIKLAGHTVLAQTGLLHRNFAKVTTELKHDGTKVTSSDLAISEGIQAAITNQFPEDQFFSEELAPTDAPIPVTSTCCWVLDPIDGTNNYANGIVYCAISLALLVEGVPAYGVIYDMARRVLIHGGPGRGVWDGDRLAQARPALPDRDSLIGFHSPVQKVHAKDGKRLIEKFKIRSLGSSTLHLAYTAIGLLDGVVEHNNRIWDVAAAAALLGEAGVEIHYIANPPFPLKKFSVKAPRIRYVAGNKAVCAALFRTISGTDE